MLKMIGSIMESKIVLVASFWILLIFSFPYTKNALVIGSVLGIGAVIVTGILSSKNKDKECWMSKVSFKEIMVSIICLAYFSICFYERYKEFEAWNKLGDIIGCPASVLLIGGMFVLAIGAFPISLFFCHYVLSNEEKRVVSVGEETTILKIAKMVICIGLGCMFLFCFSKYLWIDESFSLSLIEHDYRTLIELAAKDVHPPLYYIILKFVVDLTYKIFPFSYTRIYFAKLVSVIPYVLLLIIGEKYISKKYGKYVATFFELLILGMSNFTNYSVEIRMYSLALLFVTISFLIYVEIVEDNKSDVKKWLLFAIFSILSAYTHYYACIAVAFLYVILFINSLRKRKNILLWLVISVVTVIAYLPWLGILLSQLSKVSSGYWIEPISFSAIWDYTIFAFGYYNVFPIVLLGIVNYWRNRSKYSPKERCVIETGLLMPLWVVGIGLLASFLIRPVFVARYMFAALGAFWFALVIINNRNKGKISYFCINWGLILFAIVNICVFCVREIKDLTNANKIFEVLDSREEGTAIYSNSPQSALFISLITGEKVYTVSVFSEYEDQIYKNHSVEISDMKEIEESTIYCFWLTGSEQNGITFEKEIGEFYEGDALTLYVYEKDDK